MPRMLSMPALQKRIVVTGSFLPAGLVDKGILSGLAHLMFRAQGKGLEPPGEIDEVAKQDNDLADVTGGNFHKGLYIFVILQGFIKIAQDVNTKMLAGFDMSQQFARCSSAWN